MERIIKKIDAAEFAIPRRIPTAAYARVSSGKDEMLHSLASQVSYYSGYIQKHNEWEYMGVYADEALTGTKESRPEFQRLLADCRAGKVKQIITKSISRLARNTVTLLETVRELKELGVDVYFQREDIHSMSGDGELLLTVLASFAQEESLSVSENCKWRIKKRMEAGEPVGFVGMYGYDYSNGEIVINEGQAGIVRQIFEWYIKDGMGRSKIAKTLNEQWIPAYTGGQWGLTAVDSLLQNEKVTGNAFLQKRFTADHITKKQLRNNGEEPRWYSERTHPAIIGMETFELAQGIRRERAAKANVSDTGKNRYPFSGKIICGCCGKKYKRKPGAGRTHWNCMTYLQEGKAACPAKQVPEETLETVAAEVLELPAFDEKIFNDNISVIRIPGNNRLVFVFCDGKTDERVWKDRPRSEGWTEEKREAARQKTLAINEGRRILA
ncbi:MAG: recombinase family protein [Oscillospiraceae bacterium]|nr:recombinase family protein [Oscillospiraceae bacterium]